MRYMSDQTNKMASIINIRQKIPARRIFLTLLFLSMVGSIYLFSAHPQMANLPDLLRQA